MLKVVGRCLIEVMRTRLETLLSMFRINVPRSIRRQNGRWYVLTQAFELKAAALFALDPLSKVKR